MPSSFWRRRTSTTRQPSSSTADEEQQRQHYSTADSRPSGGNASPENDDSTPRSSPRTSRIIQGFLKRTRTLKRGANEPESAVLQKRPNLNLKVSAHASPTDHHHHHHSVKPPPRSPPDPNKPLPPTPIICDDSDVEVNVSPRTGKPVLKLSKIMATLTEDDIEKLFSGAPHFYCRSESHFAGAPHPSVAFPFDEELEIRDLCDRVPINNKAWSGVSAWPHLTRDVRRDAEKREIEKQRKAHFHIKTRERPNMLSMQGLEKGTMGFEAALELPVGDSLNEEQFGFGSIGTKAKAIVEARDSMLSEKGWLRRLPESDVLDRLMHNGDLYRNNDLKTRSSAETYKDLFHSLLRPTHAPPIDKQDHHSLVNQIDCLLKCLGMPNVWIDLSLVEWRIRLGQILWGRNDGDELDDATDISDASSVSERADERFWLLIQVLVATELLIRLDAVTEGQEFGLGNLRQIDVVRFERAATPAVKWSLLLARSWLENIQVVREKNEAATAPPVPPKPPHQHTSGWLSSLVSKVSLYYHHEHPRPIAPPYHYTIKGRHGDRQVDGLTHFARKLRWPGLDQYESRISSNAEHTMEKAQTPMPTSNTIDSTQTSYFGAWDITGNRNKKNERVQAQRRKMAAALHSSGWLSKSYIFGLLLPGEALSHFLMSTLLENDPEAMSRLGSFANLCGGFVYSGMSFWSTSCIVGRVLAAGDGASESMGWISTDIVPEGRRDGWLNICTKDVPADMAQLGRKSRIWAKKKIERESSILGDANEDSVFPADFIIPHEGSYPKQPPSLSTEFRSFKLHKSYESVLPTPLSELTPMPTPATEGSIAPELASHPASLTFTVSMNGQPSEEHTFPLTYDISFVTAYPCAPSSRVKFLKSPTSPTIQQIDVSGSDMLGNTSRSVHRAGHPLHKSFNYNIVHISELLQRRHYFLEDFLPAPLPTIRPSSRTNTNRVLVIDCTTNVLDVPPSPLFERSAPSSPVVERSGSFSSQSLESRRRNMGSDMEVLARALCSQNGWNALISRRRRGCLACAVREAGALGWAVVIRIP